MGQCCRGGACWSYSWSSAAGGAPAEASAAKASETPECISQYLQHREDLLAKVGKELKAPRRECKQLFISAQGLGVTLPGKESTAAWMR